MKNGSFNPQSGDKLFLSDEIKNVFARKDEWYDVRRQCGVATYCGGFLERAYNYLSLAPNFPDGEVEVESYDPDLENWITTHPTFLTLKVMTEESKHWMPTDRDGCVEDIPVFTISIDHRKGFELPGGPFKCQKCGNIYYCELTNTCLKCSK
ncbi:MAG: hypothetical protein WC516_04650 [Patescibacteria group bacterium]|jgi:hypothetical protein